MTSTPHPIPAVELSPQLIDGRQPIASRRGQVVRAGSGVRNIVTIGMDELPDLDPFLLFAEFGGAGPEDYIGGFPDHPHRGFETVTYVVEGRLKHADSHGNGGRLGPGAVQWMTAARGLIHAEMPDQASGPLRAFQLWINLPARNKMDVPRYQDIPAEQVPSLERDGVNVKVLAGTAFDLRSPIDAGPTDPVFLDLTLAPDSKIAVPLPRGHQVFAYVYKGCACFSEQEARAETITLFSDGDHLEVSARESTRLLLLAARAIGEPIARQGPFVMNTPQEIRQAFADYQAGRFSS
ncbi:pirin family protein [Oculatella sp. FACHB-28]|nr:pirin family protein [Oculatella sp. FACHB-28]